MSDSINKEEDDKEEEALKLEKNDISILKKINRYNKYEDLKDVKEINDIIKDLKIYNDIIGEKCAKYLNKIADEKQFKKTKFIDNCKEVKDAFIKIEKEQKKKAKGRKPRKGRAPKAEKEKPIIPPVDDKKKSDLNKMLIDGITKALKSDKPEKGILEAISAWAKQVCLDKVATPALKSITSLLSNPLKLPSKLVGWSSGKWLFSNEMYSAVGNAVACVLAVLTSLGSTILLKKVKDWWNTVKPTSDPKRDDDPPKPPDFKGGGGDDKPDDDDKPPGPPPKKDEEGPLDAYKRMMNNAKKHNAANLREATTAELERNFFRYNMPREQPPAQESSSFYTNIGLGSVGVISAGTLYGLYNRFMGGSTGAQAAQVPQAPQAPVGAVIHEGVPIPEARVIKDGPEIKQSDIDKELQEMEDANKELKEAQEEEDEAEKKETQEKQVKDAIDNMGVSRGAYASLVDPKLAGMSILETGVAAAAGAASIIQRMRERAETTIERQRERADTADSILESMRQRQEEEEIILAEREAIRAASTEGYIKPPEIDEAIERTQAIESTGQVGLGFVDEEGEAYIPEEPSDVEVEKEVTVSRKLTEEEKRAENIIDKYTDKIFEDTTPKYTQKVREAVRTLFGHQFEAVIEELDAQEKVEEIYHQFISWKK